MKKIIALIKPFDFKQKVLVYEDGNEIDMHLTKVSELNDIIFMFSEKYDVQDVDLVGPSEYLQGLRNNIKKAEFIKYSKNNLTINII